MTTDPLDRSGKPPLHAQVAKVLRADIRSGLYSPGVAIPSERKLMARFGVTRTTIRTALERLRDEGLLTSELGAGSFVRSPRRSTMFDAPAYASYIQLCRELRLERKFEAGDWYWSGPPRDYVSCCHGFNLDGEWQQGLVWLPRLDQWLAMLEEARHADVLVGLAPGGGWQMSIVNPRALAVSPTREEAAARLWRAVTGRTVTT